MLLKSRSRTESIVQSHVYFQLRSMFAETAFTSFGSLALQRAKTDNAKRWGGGGGGAGVQWCSAVLYI